MRKIEIDLDVHRCIENARDDFDESENAILRRLLGVEQVIKRQVVFKSSSPPFLKMKENVMSEPNEFSNYFEVESKIEAAKSVAPVTPKSDVNDEISAYQTKTMVDRIAGVNTAANNWSYGGASLPEGTKLKKWSRKQNYEAVIHNGSIYVNGKYYQSPSAAAMAVNGGKNVNGWNFWEYSDEEKGWQKMSQLRNDDTKFKNELPLELKELGEQFLSRVREFHNDGALQYHPKLKKYVETPSFYTVIIQSRDKSLRITIYGNPEDFKNTSILLNPDMAGYSAFKLNDVSQLDAAVSLISQAKELKQGKKR